jgi:hypothetical protein
VTRHLEVLHIPGCPNLGELLARLRRVGGPPVIIREVATEAEAELTGMSGSPTLLVDGVDPFRSARASLQPGGAIACRIYRDEHGRPVPVPSVEQLRAVLPPVPLAASESLRAARRRAVPVDPTERAVHRAILHGFAATGCPPSPASLVAPAEGSGRSAPEILAALHDLDAIRLDSAGEIAVAYPFATRPTRHRVRIAGRVEVFAMCAIDALGIAAMLDRDTRIDATEPGSGRPVTVGTVAGQTSWDPPDAVVFVGLSAAEGPSVDRCCGHLDFFADRAAAESWARSHPDLHGEVLDRPEALALGVELFGSLLA